MLKFDILVEQILDSNTVNEIQNISLTELSNINPNNTDKVKLIPYVLAKAYKKPGAAAFINEVIHKLKGVGINIDKNEIVNAARQLNIPITEEYLRRINTDNSWVNSMLNSAETAGAVNDYKQKAGDLVQRGKEWTETDGKEMLNKAKEKSIEFYNTYLSPEERESLLHYMRNLPKGRTKQATYGGPSLMGGRPGGVYIAPTR